MRESKIEGHLRTEIAKLGGWMEKHVSPGTRGPPDNIVMWGTTNANAHRVFVMRVAAGDEVCAEFSSTEFIETKAPNGDLSVLQQRDLERRRKLGFEVHVLWNMELAEAYLKSRGKR